MNKSNLANGMENQTKQSPIIWIICVFVLTRLMILVWFSPPYSEFTGYHLALASLTKEGYYPFIHYWMEYPPLFPWLSVSLYILASKIATTTASIAVVYSLAIGVVMCICEVGILLIIYQLTLLFHKNNHAERAIWFYCALFFPIFIIASFFDSLPLLFLLLALYFIIHNKETYAAIFIALGIAVKLIPLILIPVLWKISRQRLKTFSLLSFILTLCIVPFLFINASWMQTFFEVTAKRAPWETIWAIFEGEYSFGHLGPKPLGLEAHEVNKNILVQERLRSRFKTDTSFLTTSSSQLKIIYFLSGIVLFVIFIQAYKRTNLANPQSIFALSGLIVMLFFIYTKGWSPQFIVYILPFLLIAFPDKFYLPLIFSVINFIEMPIWLFYFPSSTTLLTTVIFMRTAFLIYLAILFWYEIDKEAICPS